MATLWPAEPGWPGEPASLQIGCSPWSNFLKKSLFLDTVSKKHEQGLGFEAILRPPFYTLTDGGKVY